MNTLIQANDLTKRFGTRLVVDHISLSVGEGEVFGLLGHNGAGKSTTIDLLLGLKSPDSGTSTIFSLDPRKHRKDVFSQVGVQLQSTSYQNNITVRECCEEMAALYREPADYEELLSQFGLFEFQNKKVETLSGGERQRLSVALALLPDPKVIFLDELTTGLDTVARREVWRTLLQLKKKGVSMFLTSHYMDEVEVLCDRILILDHGKEVVMDTVDNIIDKSPYKRLEEAYLWYMGEEVIA